MSNPHGTPIWYELVTRDTDAAEAFYGKVMPWSFERPKGGLDRDYRVFSTGADGVGGLVEAPPGVDFAPAWLVYVGVDDVDSTASKAEGLGARVLMGPMDIPNVGRFAFLQDPQGAYFYVMRGFSEESSRAFASENAPDKVGHCVWNELVTSDQDAALAFYGKLFGWRKEGAMPMGEMGDYSFIYSGKKRIGAMMNAPEPGTRPYWNFALQVADIDSAKTDVESSGGTVRHGPMEIPGGDWLIQVTDPEGARVMFVAAGSSRGGSNG